ncbi:VOC family protein [Paenibacillus turpanensis]|uniref:VOC family protein n=1 Tax=Paenibacillus turpanensis TaxID=2689078 RepID=UPI00140DCB17|nr:VOC family protein [Paenibacillus turpanensis]
MEPNFIFDGGFIMVPTDRFEEGVEWYKKHMGWELIDTARTPVGMKAFFRLPAGGQVNLKSFELQHEHFTPDDYEEGNVRFCFRTANLEQAIAYFQAEGIACSEPVEMPDGGKNVDITAFAGVRLTLSEDREFEGKHPDSRVIGYAPRPLWIGVKDLEAAAEWYSRMVGLQRVDTSYDEQGFVLLGDGEWDFVWLQQLPKEQPVVKANPGARLYFLIPERQAFLDTNQWLAQQGVEVCQPVGGRWMGYHLHDPDGNRLNVWSYY